MFSRNSMQTRNSYHQWLFICWSRLCVDDGRTPVPSTFTQKKTSSENYFQVYFVFFSVTLEGFYLRLSARASPTFDV